MEVIYDIYKNKPIQVPELENNYSNEGRANKKKKTSSHKAQNDSFASYNSQKGQRAEQKESPFYSSNNEDRNKNMMTNGKSTSKNESNGNPNNWLNINESLFHGNFD